MTTESLARGTVTVLPGVPGMEGLTVDDGVVPFPDTTTDFVKVMRLRGLEVRHSIARDHRIYVGHKAYELWLPLLEFSRDLFTGMSGGLLVELLVSYLRPSAVASEDQDLDDRVASSPPEPAILHVEWYVEKPNGEREVFKANGKTSDVIVALTEFEQNVRAQ